jgi:hypothetical protein
VVFQNTFEKNLIKEMIMSPFVSKNIYQSLTPFLETLFNFPWHDHYLTLVQPFLLVMIDYLQMIDQVW